MGIVRTSMVVALNCAGAASALGRTSPEPQSSLPAFDAASVKPNRSATGVTISIQGGNVRLIGVTTRQLLTRAFGVEPFDIDNGPSWVETDRFDVVARTSAEATLTDINTMFRRLLADGFGLRSHTETRESRVLFLTTVRDDGRLGRSIAPAATALSEQLGLRLDRRRGSVAVLVIDAIQPPVAD